MKDKDREALAKAIYLESLGSSGDCELEDLIRAVDEALPNDQKTLRYQLVDAVIRFAIEGMNSKGII